MSIFSELQDAMGVKKEPAVAENWEVAPRLYAKELREEYIQENIFNIGDEIVHDQRAGSNHCPQGTNH